MTKPVSRKQCCQLVTIPLAGVLLIFYLVVPIVRTVIVVASMLLFYSVSKLLAFSSGPIAFLSIHGQISYQRFVSAGHLQPLGRLYVVQLDPKRTRRRLEASRQKWRRDHGEFLCLSRGLQHQRFHG